MLAPSALAAGAARLQQALRACGRRCAPAEYAKITILALKTPAAPSRPQIGGGFFDVARKMSTLKKKKLGIFAHRWCGHLVKICPMKFCLREPKNEKNDFWSHRFRTKQLRRPAPNHKIDFFDRWAHRIQILVYKSAQHFFHAVSFPKF